MAEWHGFIKLKLKGGFASGLTHAQKVFVKGAFAPALATLVSPLASGKSRYALTLRMSDNEREIIAGALWASVPTKAQVRNAISAEMVRVAGIGAAAQGVTVNQWLGALFPSVTTATLSAVLQGAFDLDIFEGDIAEGRKAVRQYLRENRDKYSLPVSSRERAFVEGLYEALRAQGLYPPHDLWQKLHEKG